MYMSISVSAYIDRETVRARDISGAEVCYAHTCNEGTHTMRGHVCTVLISKKNYRLQRTALVPHNGHIGARHAVPMRNAAAAVSHLRSKTKK